MTDQEEYFPRGGKKPTTSLYKQSANFLGAPEKVERKKKKPKKRTDGDDDGYLSDDGTREIDKSAQNCAYGLSYKSIKQGVLLLGRVKHVTETKIIVSLPCRMLGTVMACHISEAYNKLLEAYVNDQTEKVRELQQMFRPGQYVAVSVLEVKDTSLMLSMMPQHVNSGKILTDLHKGTVLQAAVSSVEDHGYVMDIGIPNTRAFLPKNNTNPDVELEAGVLTWCAVISTQASSDNSVVTLSNTLEAMQRGVLRYKPNTPILPATTVEFTVDTPLDTGIEGHVFGDVTAYIQRQHTDTVKGKKPSLGQKIRARILYVMPTRNTPYLTMKNVFETTYPDVGEEQKLKEGDIVEEAQVFKIIGRAIHFKLGQGCIGTMSLNKIQVDEELTDEQVIAKSYPIGSIHKVRVTSYNLSDFLYSVSDHAELLQEKYFSLQYLQVGQVVDGAVKTVAESHVLLTVGRVVGFVSHTHLTDSGVFVDPKKSSNAKLPKKKFKVGQEVKARVLSVDVARNSLHLTMKPSLLAPDLDVLQEYEQAEVGKAYTGVIKFIRDYVLVSFFNNVTALVPRKNVTKQPLDNLTDAYHLGQIVNCTILKVNLKDKKMTGSFTTQPFWPNKIRERPEKRQHQNENTNELPQKKRKADKQQKLDIVQEQTEPKEKRINKKSKEEPIAEEDSDISDDFDRYVDSEVSEHDGTEKVVDNPVLPEKGLIDLSDCETIAQLKERISKLLSTINARVRRLNTLHKKRKRIEDKGLNAKNKKIHAALTKEAHVMQERIGKLKETTKLAYSKKHELSLIKKEKREAEEAKLQKQKDDKPDNKKETKVEEKSKKEQKSQAKEKSLTSDKTKENKKDDKKKQEKAEKMKEFKVVDSLKPVLNVPSAKDFWSAPIESASKTVQEDESSSSDDEEADQPKKKRKKLTVADKLAKAREEEDRLREMERRAIESESQPRSSDQFERALLANPNCSQLWIAYMAFHLQATEIEKARAVGRKALSTISFREEDEKLNVWIAMLNFENRFGTKESQQKTLEEALQMNDTFKVHSKLLDIYVETAKHQELASLVDLMLRKYKRDPNTYLRCGAACYKLNLVDKARHVMQKAIAVLEKKEHVTILVQFALQERSHGGRERAEALFEQVLSTYPQRVDVCSVYVDMLVKDGDIEHVRQVMERMTSQKLPARKMKVLYKKWIEVEEKLGDSEQVAKIKQRAMEYIEKAKF